MEGDGDNMMGMAVLREELLPLGYMFDDVVAVEERLTIWAMGESWRKRQELDSTTGGATNTTTLTSYSQRVPGSQKYISKQPGPQLPGGYNII